MRKIAIIGSSSITGQAIKKVLSNELDSEIILYTRNKSLIDLSAGKNQVEIIPENKKELRESILKHQPSYIINCVGFSSVIENETDKKTSQDLNVTFLEYISKTAAIVGANFISFSTDNVFDGVKGLYGENDKPNPINYFGKSKLAAENFIKTNIPNSTILRLNNVFGFSFFRKNDLATFIKSSLEMGEPVYMPEFIKFNPSFSDDIGRAVFKIIEKNRSGIYHVGCKDYVSSFDFAKELARVFNYDEDLVKSISREEINNKVRHVENGGFITLKAETDLNFQMSTLKDSLTSIKFQFEQNKKYL